MVKHAISELPVDSARHALIPKVQIQMHKRKSQITQPTTSFALTQQQTFQLTQKKSLVPQLSNIQEDPRQSIASTNLIKFKKKRKPVKKNYYPIQIKENYDIGDLTHTLTQQKIKIGVSFFLFFTSVSLRYYTFADCLYISKVSNRWEWIIPFILVRLVFLFLVIKISLSIAQTKTQVLLKNSWNSMSNEGHQYFDVVSVKRLFISILKGFLPPQLSFMYINTTNTKKKYEIFVSINFIFVSIQQIAFYPFFIIYSIVLTVDQNFALNVYYEDATIVINIIGFFIFIGLCIYLIYRGVKIKYGSLRYFCSNYILLKSKEKIIMEFDGLQEFK